MRKTPSFSSWFLKIAFSQKFPKVWFDSFFLGHPVREYKLFPLTKPLRHARPGRQPPQAPWSWSRSWRKCSLETTEIMTSEKGRLSLSGWKELWFDREAKEISHPTYAMQRLLNEHERKKNDICRQISNFNLVNNGLYSKSASLRH